MLTPSANFFISQICIFLILYTQKLPIYSNYKKSVDLDKNQYVPKSNFVNYISLQIVVLLEIVVFCIIVCLFNVLELNLYERKLDINSFTDILTN